MPHMKSKSEADILNQWWADGIPIGTPGGASGSALHLPVAVRTIGGATPTMTSGAQLVYQTALEKSTPTIYNVTVASGLEEYPRGLPANCRALQFRCRQVQDIRYAFETGKVATAQSPYMTLFSDEIYSEEGLKLTAATLYLGAASPALVVEVEVWT